MEIGWVVLKIRGAWAEVSSVSTKKVTENGFDRNTRKFLVTGATGFVGEYLLEALVRRYGSGSAIAMVYTSGRCSEEAKLQELREKGVVVFECDLMQLPDLGLRVPDFDVVYHLAGFAESETEHGPFEVNSIGTRNLLEWLGPSLKGKRFIYTSTIAGIDAEKPAIPVDEKTPCNPLTRYGKTKMEGEEYVSKLSSKLGFDYNILRLCTIVGKGFRPGGMFGVIPELLAKNAFSVRLNWPGRGSYLGMKDLIHILLAVPEHPGTANQVYLLGNGEGPTFDEVVQGIAHVLGMPRKRIRLPAWCWHLFYRVAWTVVKSNLLPFRLHVASWRAAHIIGNAFWANNSRITQTLGIKYQPFIDALRDAYDK